MSKWDNRRSGRTTKMLLAALKRARDTGRTVVCVVPSAEVKEIRTHALVFIAQDYGGIWDARVNEYKTHSGGRIYLMPMRNGAVNLKTLHVDRFDPEDVFWDHEVIRQGHNRILQEFHRYD